MSNILQRKKNLNQPVKKTREEYAEDALYREVWEDVNNEKTQKFIKKYWRHITVAVIAIMIVVCGVQLGVRMHNSAKIAVAQNYESAIASFDAKALENIAKNSSGATADLALFQSYLLDRNIAKLEELEKHAASRDFRDLAKLHIASIRGDEMSAKDFAKYLSSVDTKKSPFFYTARLMVAQKYIASNDKESADKILDEIIQDENAPASVVSNAQLLK